MSEKEVKNFTLSKADDRNGIIVIALFAIVVIWIFASGGSSSTSKTSTTSQEAAPTFDIEELAKSVSELEEAGLIKKLDPVLDNVYVNRALWDSTNIDQKKAFAWKVARYLDRGEASQVYRLDIYDWQSGKRLAKYSDAFGYTAE